MARTVLTPKTIATEQKVGTIVADSADLTLTAADVGNGNRFLCLGKELLIVKNTEAVDPQTVTITAAPDALGRTGSVAAYSLAAGDYAVFGPFPPDNFKQSDGYVWIDGSAATVVFAVVKMP